MDHISKKLSQGGGGRKSGWKRNFEAFYVPFSLGVTKLARLALSLAHIWAKKRRRFLSFCVGERRTKREKKGSWRIWNSKGGKTYFCAWKWFLQGKKKGGWVRIISGGRKKEREGRREGERARQTRNFPFSFIFFQERESHQNLKGRKKWEKKEKHFVRIIFGKTHEWKTAKFLTSFVFHRCLWLGKWSDLGSDSRLSGSLSGSPSGKEKEATRAQKLRANTSASEGGAKKLALNRTWWEKRRGKLRSSVSTPSSSSFSPSPRRK